MNALAAMCFDANAAIDNLAYNLDYHYYNQIAEVVHLHVAHVMPEWADMVTNKLLELSARPVRLPIPRIWASTAPWQPRTCWPARPWKRSRSAPAACTKSPKSSARRTKLKNPFHNKE